MTRWTFLLPRLILIVILLTIVSLGVDPAIRWALINAAQSTSGASLSARHVNANLADGRAIVHQLSLATASDPAHGMIEVDRAALKFDPWALACGRLVIEDGELQGVRINTDAGCADCARVAARPQLASEATALGAAWQRAVSADAQAPSPPLQTINDTQQLQRRRSDEFQQILRQAANWQARFDELDELTRIVGDNPLRMTPEYRARLLELAAVGEEIQSLNETLRTLQRQVQQDRMLLEQSREQELATLRDQMRMEPVSGERLSNYLLEDEWAPRVGAWVNWIREARKVADLRPTRPRFAWGNSRGVDVLLNAGRQSDFEVRNLYLQGSGQVDGQVFRFHGTMQNLCDEPQHATRPTVLTLAAEGEGEIQMDAVLDRSSETGVDRIRVVCPALPAPRKVWGDPREFAVEAGPGTLRLALHMEIRDDQVQGHVEFSRSETELVPSWPGSRRDGPANETIQVALQEVRQVSGAVELSGTLQHPVWQLESDLGEEVASRMQSVLQSELRQRTELLVSQCEAQMDEQLRQFAASLNQQERTAAEQVAAKSNELAQFRHRIAQRTDLMDQLVRNAGPLENLLR